MAYDRVRSKGSISRNYSLPTTYKRIDASCTSGTETIWTWYLADTGDYSYCKDVVTPGYERKSRKGKIIINPATITTEKHTAEGTWSRMKWIATSCSSPVKHFVEDISGPYGGYMLGGTGTRLQPVSLISASEKDALIALAAADCWDKTNENDASILQDLAEYRQTLTLLPSLLSQSSRLLSSMIRAKRKLISAKQLGLLTSSVATNLWLQYRFGIRPLISTANGVVEAYSKGFQKLHRQTYRAGKSLSREETVTGSGADWSTGIYWSRYNKHDVKVRAGIILEQDISINRRLGVDSAGLLSLPWELLPYSFVADWFTNVGSWLRGLTAFLTKDPLGTWYTVRETFNSSWTITGSWNAAPTQITIEREPNELRTLVKTSYQRRTPLPIPSIATRPGSILKVAKSLRSVDALALTFQQIGKVLR